VLDAIITNPVDVRFDLIWRRGTTDTTLSLWQMHFDPLPGSFDAQPFEFDQQAIAIDWKEGDQLVFRYTGTGTTISEAYVPNGDGARAKGRIPNITLPQ